MRRLLIVVNLLILIVIAGGVAAYYRLAPGIPRLPDDLRLLASTPATEVYSRGGELLGRLGGRHYIALDRISPHFLNAVVAAEDRRFFEHRGIDRIATVRALWQNLRQRGDAPGGSSITQQLAKNLFFSFKRSWERKALEALTAFAIEARFSKEEILEAYCNLVYFGRFAYGVERASRTYFNKHARQLELHEAALLAGLPNAPARLDPFSNPDQARERQRLILERMARAGYIEWRQIDSLTARPVTLSNAAPPPERGSFAVDAALEGARGRLSGDLVNYGGVKIYTTIDPRLQRIAERKVAAGVDLLERSIRPPKVGEDPSGRLEGGLVAVEVKSGQIVALVGGRNYLDSPYNRATRSRRQPGSAFKPVIYLTALEQGNITPASVYRDEPVALKIDSRRTWRPTNFDKRFTGPVVLKLALMKSINTVAAQLISETGPDKVIATARRLGIESPLEPHLSLALGSTGLTMVEMATAIATIAREGYFIESRLLSRIEGPGGETLASLASAGEQRFDPETTYMLIDMLSGVLDSGTGTIVRRRGFSGTAFGKTGTSSDYRDSWFVGASPHLAVVAWVGYDDNRKMYLKNGVGVTGASGAAPIWADFMIAATEGDPPREFQVPDGVERSFVEPVTGRVSRNYLDGYLPVMLKSESKSGWFGF